MFNNKGGYGYEVYFVMEKNKLHFVRETSVELANEEIKNVEAYFSSKYGNISFKIFDKKKSLQ
jgi:hypothetical protein